MPLALSGTPLILLLVSLSTGRHISSNKQSRAACVCMISTCNLCSFMHKWARLHHDKCTLCFFFNCSSPVFEHHQFADKLRMTFLYVDRSLMLCCCALFVYFVPLSDPDSPWNDCKGLCQKGHLHLKSYAKLNKQIRFNKTPWSK